MATWIKQTNTDKCSSTALEDSSQRSISFLENTRLSPMKLLTFDSHQVITKAEDLFRRRRLFRTANQLSETTRTKDCGENH